MRWRIDSLSWFATRTGNRLMLRLVHLSDIHIGQSEAELINSRTIVAHILRWFRGDVADTRIIITGDLVHNGKVEEFYLFEREVLDPLRSNFPVMLSPGNHDYANAGTWFNSESVGFFRDLSGASCPAGAPCACVHVVESEQTVIVGLDSADPDNKVWFGDGYFNQVQADALDSALSDYQKYLKIVHFHHHPFFLRFGVVLWGSTKILRAMADVDVEMVLFGHKHASELFLDREVPFMLASGKVTEPERGALRFRVVEIDCGGISRIYEEAVRA